MFRPDNTAVGFLNVLTPQRGRVLVETMYPSFDCPLARIKFEGEHAGLGARFPLGITHLLAQEPIDLFFELAPVLNLGPDTGLDLEGGIGIRYYLK